MFVETLFFYKSVNSDRADFDPNQYDKQDTQEYIV